jgi:hypothetical protein
MSATPPNISRNCLSDAAPGALQFAPPWSNVDLPTDQIHPGAECQLLTADLVWPIANCQLLLFSRYD